MAAALGQNKTMRFLVLNASSGRQFGSGLTHYSAVKQFMKYLLLGVSRNSTLDEVKLQSSCLSGFIIREFMWCYSRLTLLVSYMLQYSSCHCSLLCLTCSSSSGNTQLVNILFRLVLFQHFWLCMCILLSFIFCTRCFGIITLICWQHHLCSPLEVSLQWTPHWKLVF